MNILTRRRFLNSASPYYIVRINYYGSAEDYQLQELANGSTQIFSGESELIAVVKGVTGLNLSSATQFLYT